MIYVCVCVKGRDRSRAINNQLLANGFLVFKQVSDIFTQIKKILNFSTSPNYISTETEEEVCSPSHTN